MDRNLLMDGSPWWATVKFTGSNLGAAFEIVRPKYNLTIASSGSFPADTNTASIKENNRLIVLGMDYVFHAAANSGFEIYYQYDDAGGTVQSVIANVVAGTTNATVVNGFETFKPGIAGRIVSSGNAKAPASLYIAAATGGQPSLGYVSIWGIHVDAGWRIGKLYDKTIAAKDGTLTTLNFNTASSNN